jgi:thioredoxin reductase
MINKFINHSINFEEKLNDIEYEKIKNFIKNNLIYKSKIFNITVIGGGPAGLAAAYEAQKNIEDVILIEREEKLGGILKQCIHDGFGLVKFNKKLTGPEYADIYIQMIKKSKVEVFLETFVLKIEKKIIENEKIFELILVNKKNNIFKILTRSLILSTGCRERTSKQIFLHGTRPSGIYTAGLAQYFINIQGYLPGKNVVILGSGDIGLIMARRLTLEGAKVLGVYEIKDEPSGLTRNIVQCLNDYNIPLYLRTTIKEVHGKERINGVTIVKVDENLNPISGTEQFIPCDTLILSVGLIPENDIIDSLNIKISNETKGPIVNQTLMTDEEGVFSCGNSLHVNDLVDYVSESAEIAGFWATNYIKNKSNFKKEEIEVKFDNNILYVVPQKIDLTKLGKFPLFFRSKYTFKNKTLKIFDNIGNEIYTKKYISLRPPEMEKIEIDINRLNKNIKSISLSLN